MNGARKAGIAMLLGYGLLVALVVAVLVAMVRVDCSGAWCAPWLIFEVAAFLVAVVVLLAAGVVLVPAGYAFARFGKAGANVRIVVRRRGQAGGHDPQGAGHGRGPHRDGDGTQGPSDPDIIDVDAREIRRP